MDYKTISAMLGDTPGLTDYDKMVADRRAKTQAELAGLDEVQSLIDYTTPPQLKAAKMAEIEDRRGALTAEQRALETDEDFLRRYAASHQTATSDPAPTASRSMDPYQVPTAKDMIRQPQMSEQRFQTSPVIDPSQLYSPPYTLAPEAGAGGEILGEFSRGVARGAADMVASTPSIFGALQAESNRNAVAYLDQAETLLYQMADLKRAGMDEFEFIQQASDMMESAPQAIRPKITQAIGHINAGRDPDEVIAKFREDMMALPVETEETGGFQLGERMHGAVDEALPVRPGYEDSWTTKIGEGAGSLGPMLAGSLVNPALGIGVGMASQGGASVEEAVRDGAEEDDVLKYGLAGTAIGSLEALPVGRLLGTGAGLTGRLAQAAEPLGKVLGISGGALGSLRRAAPETMAKVSEIAAKLSPAGKSKLAKIVADVVGQGFEEGAQEGLSQTLLNEAARLTYDENRDLFEGVPESMAIGAIVGGGVGGIKGLGREALDYRDELPDTQNNTSPGEQGDRGSVRSSPSPDSGAPGGAGGGLGGLEGDVLRGEVDVAEPVAGTLGRDPLDLGANKVTTRPEEPRASAGLGGLEGEILDREKTPARAAPVKGTLEGPVVEGTVNRDRIEGKRQLPGSTEDYEVIDEGGTEDLVNYSRKSLPSRPLQIERREDLEEAAKDVKEPTEAQKEAGNYRKGHIKIHGLGITVETPKGAMRRGKAADGTDWEVEMPGDYGYFKRSKGMDGDHVDVTVGPDIDSDKIYVIDQVDADTKENDEHKVIAGTKSPEQAAELYRRQFSDGKGDQRMGAMVEMDAATFKGWLETGRTDKPIAGQKVGTPVDPKGNPAIDAVAKRFGLTPDEVRSIVDTGDVQKAYREASEKGVVSAEAGRQRAKATSDDRSTIPTPENAPAGRSGENRKYPIAPRSEWYGEANFEQAGGQMVEMTPEEYLSRVRPLKMDDESRENIDLLKEHIQSGKTLDPLKIFDGGKEDGRHRAMAAKELGISKVPVVLFGDQKSKIVSKDADKVYEGVKEGRTNEQGTKTAPGSAGVQPGLRQPGSDSAVARPGDQGSQPAKGGVSPKSGSAEGGKPAGESRRGARSQHPKAADARGRNRGRYPDGVQQFAEKEGDSEKLTLTHFGHKFHTTIKPSDGWRSGGAEKERAGHPDFVQRSYYGIGTGKPGGYQKDVAGKFGHKTSIDPAELYDFEADPDSLNPGNVNSYEKAIKDAGYAGYVVRIGVKGQNGPAAVLFYEAEAEEHFDDGIDDPKDLPRAKGLERSVKLGATNKRLYVGPVKRAREAKALYAKRSGIRPATTIREYVKVDEDRARRIAQAFEEMKHDPKDPLVKSAYDAMIKETLDQYQAMLDSGFKAEMIPSGAPDPYADSPRLAIEDIRDNNHMWVFPTDDGFGSSDLDVSDNPLLAETKYKDVNGKVMLANDVFRAVHDYFGHAVEGNGMRARGEEMAWRVHASMYSPLARRAMTTETRGQNSWVNYGPHGEANKTASGSETTYAPQKIGLLPEWVSEEGLHDPTHLANIARMKKAMAGRKFGEPAYVRQTRESKPDSLIEFIAKNGGIKEQTGELRSIGLTDRKTGFVAGHGPVVRSTGNPPDRVREMVEQAGYLPEGSTLADLYDALDQDARSGREFFSQADQDQAERWREAEKGLADIPFFGDVYRLAPRDEALMKWFGKSKMIDEDGNPAVYHHTTHNDFTVFDRKWADGRYQKDGKRLTDTIDQLGSWFTDEKGGRRYGPKEMSVYLKIEKPFYIDDGSWNDDKENQPTYGKDDVWTRLNNLVKEYGGAEGLRKALKADGHDGVILQGWLDGYRGTIPIVFEPNQIKDIDNETFDPNNDDIRYNLSPGFYSNITRGIEKAKQVKAPAKDWKAIIAALPGVRKAEIEWIDVNGWLDSQEGQVTKEDLVAYVKANEIEIRETILTKNGIDMSGDRPFDIEIDDDPDIIDPDDEWLDQLAEDYMDEAREEARDRLDDDEEEIDEDWVKERARELAHRSYMENPERQGDITITYGDGSREGFVYTQNEFSFYWEGQDFDSWQDLRNAIEEHAEGNASDKGIDTAFVDYGTQYDSYVEQGGRNYREILLSMPGLHEEGTNAIHRLGQDMVRGQVRDREAYESSHFSKTPNIIVHARTTDRQNGQVLFVEEVQSDLGSDIRKEIEDQGSPPTEEDFARWKQLRDDEIEGASDLVKANADLAHAFERGYPGFDENNKLHSDFYSDLYNGHSIDLQDAAESDSDFFQFPYNMKSYTREQRDQLKPMVKWMRENLKEEMDAEDVARSKKSDARLRRMEMKDPHKWEMTTLPRFPFEGESYYHLAMKRLLRLAVDEGKGAIAWTPAYMQGRRWSQAVQNVVNRIEWGRLASADGHRAVTLHGVNGQDVVWFDSNGVMQDAVSRNFQQSDIKGKKLSELLGSNLAKRVIEEPAGDVRGENIVIGGDGYKIAYDRHMKNFMEKFAKKYGGQVVVDKKIMGAMSVDQMVRAVKEDESVSFKSLRQALLDTGKFDEKGLDSVFDGYVERMGQIAEEQVARAKEDLKNAEIGLQQDIDAGSSELARSYMQGQVDSHKKSVEDWISKSRQIKERKGPYYEFNAKSALIRSAGNGMSEVDIKNMLWPLVEGNADPVWRVDITPQMRDAILEGQPFSIGREDYRLTPEAQNKIDELLAVIKKVAPGLKVRMDMSIDSDKNIWGKYSRDTGAITIAAVALQAGRGKQVFGHEALHAFVDHGLLKPEEIAILQRYADKHDLIGKYGLREQYEKAYGSRGLDPADYQRMINEEGIAELVGELIGNPKAEIPGELSGIIGKLKRLLERVANAIRGLGFQTTRDILEKIASGEVGQRTVEGFTPKDGVLYSLGQDHVTSIKRTTADDLGDFLVSDRKTIRKARAAQRYLQDKFLSVKLLQRSLADQVIDDENAYLAEELSAARIPEQTQEMNDRMQDVLEDLHEAGIDHEMFERFLRMRHAKERNEHIAKINTKFPDGGSGIRTKVAERWLRNARRLMPADKWTAMQDAASKVYAISKDSLKIRLDGGLIDQAYYNELVNQYRYYVPLKGHEFAEDLKPISTNRGYGAKGKGITQAMGRRSEAQNTLSYVVEDYRRAIYSSERNKVNIALFEFIRNNRKLKADGTLAKNDYIELDPIRYKRILVKKRGLYQGRKIWVPADFVGDNAKIASYLAGLEGNASERLRLDPTPAHNDLPVMINGKRHIMRVKNDTLLNDLLDMHTNVDRLPFYSAAMSGFTRMLTMWNPAFGPTNFVRDVMGVGLVAGSELGAKDAVKVMADAFKMTRIILKSVRGKTSTNPETQKLIDLYKEMKLSGGSTGFSHVVRDAETIQRELESQAEWLAGNRSVKQILKHGVVTLDRVMEKFNRVFEDATRLAAYKNRLDAGDTQKQALSYAKNVTVNFNKRGHQTFFSQWYAFANANFQGNYRMLRALINGKNGGKVLSGLFMGGFLYGLANILMGYDDENPEKINSWYERNQYDKAFYIILGPIKLPKPHGFMIPFDIGTKAAELMMAAIDPEHCNPERRSVPDLTASALAEVGAGLTSFVPIGTQEDTILRFFPTLTAPLASAALNMSPFGGSIYPEGFDRTQPNWKQFYAETPEIYHKTAQWLNTLSGGNEFQAGYIDLSPEVIEFLINSYLGGAGGELRKTSALAMTGLDAALGNETRPIRSEDIPIIRRFLPSERTNALTDYYFAFSNRMQEVKNAISAAKEGSESARQFLKEHEVERRLLNQWEATKKQRTAIRKRLEKLDEERRGGSSVGLRRDALINKRALIERRFARVYQIEDQIADLKSREQNQATRFAINKLQRDREVMQENIAKLVADQDSLIASRTTDSGRVSSLGQMFK